MWYNVMNIVTLWLKVMKSCHKSCKIVKSVQRCAKVAKKKIIKWTNKNWIQFYKELLSQSFEVLQMWPRHTQPPVSEIAIVYMVSMLFPWHFIGIIWHSGGMLWNAMEFHGIQKIAIVSMVFMVFYGILVEFYGIQVECCGMPWNFIGYRRLP